MSEIKNNVDRQYFELIKKILDTGVQKMDRTGTGTISIFDATMRFNMDEGFPILTSKKMYLKGIIYELIWFLGGDTNIKYLLDNDVNIWTGDAYRKYRNTPKEKMCDGDLEFLSASHAYEDYYSKEDFVERIKTDIRFSEKWGELGPVYGSQWRKWGKSNSNDFERAKRHLLGLGSDIEVDQIKVLINDLKNDPDSRRLIVTAWNPLDLPHSTLPPCHYMFQCYTQEMNLEERVRRWCSSINKNILYGEDMNHERLDEIGFPKRKLSLKWTQRSCDFFLGIPFNITSYSLLLHLLSNEVNMIPGELIFSGGDIHIYSNHINQVKEQLKRETFELPSLVLKNTSIFELSYDDVELVGYKSCGVLKADLSN